MPFSSLLAIFSEYLKSELWPVEKLAFSEKRREGHDPGVPIRIAVERSRAWARRTKRSVSSTPEAPLPNPYSGPPPRHRFLRPDAVLESPARAADQPCI